MKKLFFLLLSAFIACSNNRKEANYYFIKGLNEYQKNEKIKAMENYQKAYELDRNNIEIIRELAFLYADFGDIKKSKEYYLKALDLKPYDENTLENLLNILYNERNMKDFLKYSEQILDKNSLLYRHSQARLKALEN